MKPFSLVDRHATRNRSQEGLMTTEHHPLSPPDTESIYSNLDQYTTTQRRPSLAHQDPALALPTIPATPEVPRESAGARFRRLAGIPTTQSGPREFRGASRPQTRWLIVLMPPAHLTTELAVGHRSPGRIADGLLIPLFPSLFAQLTAVAKEFSLPSTTGLCLYLHLPDAPATPRITDDTWPLLWNRHLHADDSALPLGLPVAGRVEFDIDIPNARWYPMWFAHVSRQELVPDLARAIPPSPRALGKVDLSPHEPSRTTKSVPRPLALAPRTDPVVEVQVVSGPSPVPSPSRPNIPKSASKETVDKVRRWSALVTPDPALRAALLPTESIPVESPSALPSIEDTSAPLLTEEAVGDEPLNLEDFQWSITSAGPPSPTSSCATSASSRVVSIHLLQRNEGSVLLTPTTATSWGPPSVSDIESELNLNLGWRVRSPDIGERAEGSVLLTPSTATSWGAPLSYPPTPAQWIAMQEFVRSPDMGERAEGSVLLTPSTATTWGAPLSYPPTPAEWHALQQYIRSPDAGERAEGSVALTPSTATTWGAPETYPPTPETWADAQRRWVASPDLGMRAEVEGEFGRERMSRVAWGSEVETEEQAYARMGIPWRWEFGWPRETREQFSVIDGGASLGPLDEEPEAELVPVVLVTQGAEVQAETFEFGWPQFEVDGGDVITDVESIALSEGHSAEFGVLGADRDLDGETDVFEYELPPFEPVAHHEEEDGDEDVTTSDAFEYELPAFELAADENDDEVAEGSDYDLPHFELDISRNGGASTNMAADGSEYGFPHSEPPASELDMAQLSPFEAPVLATTVTTESLAVVKTTHTGLTEVALQSRSYGSYPFLVLYPTIYPHLELYPAPPGTTASQSPQSLLCLDTQMNRTEAPSSTTTVVNAHVVGLAQSTSTISPVEPNNSATSETASSAPSLPSRKPSLSVHLPRARSGTILAVNPDDKRSRAWSRALPPVPPVPREAITRKENVESVAPVIPRGLEELGNKSSVVFDNTEFELLPSKKKPTLSSAYPYQYPHNLAQLYPVVGTLGYPRNLELLYPIVEDQVTALATSIPSSVWKEQPQSRQLDNWPTTCSVLSSKAYPDFNLYPAVYPYNLSGIYPARSTLVVPPARAAPTTNKVALTPTKLTVLPTQSEHFSDIRARLVPTYPTFDLFPAVYPHNLERIYPASSARLTPTAPHKSRSQTHILECKSEKATALPTVVNTLASTRLAPRYPVFDLFPAVYPHNLVSIYPVSEKVSKPSIVSLSRSLSQIQKTAINSVQLVAKPVTNVTVRLARAYPNIELYEPVYPFSLDIYPLGVIKDNIDMSRNAAFEQGGKTTTRANADLVMDKQTIETTSRHRKTHAQLCIEVGRKTHATLVAEVVKGTTPTRPRKSHSELQEEILPDSLPTPAPAMPGSPHVMVTPVQRTIDRPGFEAIPSEIPLRRQRSGTIMIQAPPPQTSLPPPAPQGADLSRSRSMLEARTQMFEERAAPARSQTIGAPRLTRQKSASFERTMSLFHASEESGKAASEGSRTPPRAPVRRVTKLDMSKFGFA